nr:1-deoxy-D-xylulose-5-phosphate reductoisomerase [bacterium]
LDDKLAYTDIARVIEGALAALPAAPVNDLDDALAADAEARRVAEVLIAKKHGA